MNLFTRLASCHQKEREPWRMRQRTKFKKEGEQKKTAQTWLGLRPVLPKALQSLALFLAVSRSIGFPCDFCPRYILISQLIKTNSNLSILISIALCEMLSFFLTLHPLLKKFIQTFLLPFYYTAVSVFPIIDLTPNVCTVDDNCTSLSSRHQRGKQHASHRG